MVAASGQRRAAASTKVRGRHRRGGPGAQVAWAAMAASCGAFRSRIRAWLFAMHLECTGGGPLLGDTFMNRRKNTATQPPRKPPAIPQRLSCHAPASTRSFVVLSTDRHSKWVQYMRGTKGLIDRSPLFFVLRPVQIVRAKRLCPPPDFLPVHFCNKLRFP